MRWLRNPTFLLGLLLSCAAALGAEFKLITGDVYRGELSVADDNGIVVRLETGEFSPRIDWARLSDETLKALVSNPRAQQFVEPLIEPEEPVITAPPIPINVRPVPGRVTLPETDTGLLAALVTPNGVILLLALFAANLYAAYQVARFKWRPTTLVCGLSAVLPVAGWLIFLLLPRNTAPEEENATEAAVAGTVVSAGGGTASASDSPRSGAAAALGLSKGQAGPAADGSPKVFKRGETTFNRRFFETQFPSFFRVVSTDADRDLVLDVAAGRSSVVASRVSRISSNEIHFKTANNQEVSVNFADMVQVTLRHKDAA